MPLQDDGDISRDPYRLHCLAEELESRDMSRPIQLNHADRSSEFPVHEPLSHGNQFLSAKSFNVEEFLLTRSHIPLLDLRTELRQYHSQLKEELVRLINDDYEAFISLSTDLRDEGDRLGRLKLPLTNLKMEVTESKTALQAIQGVIHRRLAQRSKLREEKSLLHLLLKISESVARLESLLSIAPPHQAANQRIEMNDVNFTAYSSYIENSFDEGSRGNRAKHLGRVAIEYTQLLYHVRKAQAQSCSFVKETQWRIDRVHSALCSDLDQLFGETVVLLTSLKEQSRGTELERNKWTTDLAECLRTYDTLGLWRDAEDVLRRGLVQPFVKKEIHPSTLIATHSPIVPRTPFRSSDPDAGSPTVASYRLPYTPFTAFFPKQEQNQFAPSDLNIPQAQLLQDSENPLAGVYNQILRFVERNICQIMTIAEKIRVKQNPGKQAERDDLYVENCDANIGSSHFEIMANVVWDEFGKSIMEELGGIVFSVGRPDEFRENYETTKAFIHSLEILAPSMQAVYAMRCHPTYLTFERRWQLPVYFQLRWKEIVGGLEEVYMSARPEPIASKEGSFFTLQASATWIALTACWSSEIYIPELSHRFWKLTLQILSRFTTWVTQNFAFADPLTPEKVSSSLRGSGSGTAIETSSAEIAAADDASLRHYTAIIADIVTMERSALNLWNLVIKVVLSDVHGDDCMQMEAALREGIDCLTNFITHLSDQIIAILTRRCCDGLLPVRSIPSQFRAMSNKRMPSEPSYFVSSILRPLKHFFAVGVSEGIGSPLQHKFYESFSTEVFNNVTQKYIGYLTTMKRTEESLKRLKNKKPTYSLFGNTTSVNDVRDEERIRSQMILDVEAYGKDAESLRVDVSKNLNFITLKEMVYASESD